ncbi:protein yippee-like [Anopheles moucheti]|uniref:protein yippee-like n=1 Tax=Anopheles moucheti TaxID=186751 RepID=UPI0022F0826A|nr:protein yippee-like [Anopheles moucheti]
MGRVFLEHINGQKLYNCAVCNTNLTNWEQLISTRFHGATGPAYLFRRVVNLTHSEVQCRYMNTGYHLVREVICKKCKVKLGWMYEFAMQKPQEYKEGAVLLERCLIVDAKGFPDKEE